MRGRFTSGLLAALILGGCASVPMPFQDRAARDVPADARTERLAEGNQNVRSQPGEPLAPTIPVKSGNQALFDRAVALLAEGRHDAAEVLLLEITDSQPELAGPWVNLGHIRLARKELQGAEQMFDRALQANPANCDALNALGVLARQAGEFTAAEGHYQQCIEARPDFAAARLNLGILYELYMGRYGEALASYQDYQLMLAEPDAQVNGWVVDLERRVAAIAQR